MAAAPYATGYNGQFNYSGSTSIGSGQTDSAAIPCGGFVLCGVFLPAAFTGTTLKFTACQTVDGTYLAVKKADGTDLSYTVAQGTYVAIDPKDLQGINFLKIKSGSSEGAARTLGISLKG